MKASTPARRAKIWAAVGAAVLIAGVGAFVVGGLLNSKTTPAAPITSAPADAPSAAEPTPKTPFVDETVAKKGWVPEPVTTDAETYLRAAMSAAGTFDTTTSAYEDWIAHLGTWFTPDTRYASESDRQTELDAAKLEMRQGVVLPEAEWDSLARESGRVSSVVVGDISLASVAQDAAGDMSIGTADIAITYTRSDGEGGEVTYNESTRLSVQVACGDQTVPTPGSTQSAGDCKVIRFFTEPLEP